MESFSYILEFLRSLLLTVGIETVVLIGVIRVFFKESKTRLSLSKLLFAGTCASFTTLPYLWFVLPALIEDYTLFLVAGEFTVFAFEAVFYLFVLQLNWKKATLLSLLCNLVSFLIGLLLQNLLH